MSGFLKMIYFIIKKIINKFHKNINLFDYFKMIVCLLSVEKRKKKKEKEKFEKRIERDWKEESCCAMCQCKTQCNSTQPLCPLKPLSQILSLHLSFHCASITMTNATETQPQQHKVSLPFSHTQILGFRFCIYFSILFCGINRHQDFVAVLF